MTLHADGARRVAVDLPWVEWMRCMEGLAGWRVIDGRRV